MGLWKSNGTTTIEPGEWFCCHLFSTLDAFVVCGQSVTS